MEDRSQHADDPRMRELILYLATRSDSDWRFSTAKLTQLLFLCDFSAYRRLGRSISGQTYQKLRVGPSPIDLLSRLEQMLAEGDCAEIEAPHFGHPHKKLVARRPPDLAVFTPEELALADQIVADLWESDAKEVSELSHDFIGWKAAELGETIPYETVLVGDSAKPVSEDKATYCRTLATAE